MAFIKVSIISVGDNIYIYGIRSISAYLKKHGHDTQLIFLPSYQKQYPKKILRDLRSLVKESNLIGISCTSYTSDKAIQVIKYLKSLKIPAIWGGIHATFNPDECIKYADIVCIGEGEETMLELVKKLSKKENITKIRNLWVKKNGRIYKNDVRPLIQDLDKLPHADYDFENQWVLDNGKIVNMSEKHLGEGEFNQYVPFKVRKFLQNFDFQG